MFPVKRIQESWKDVERRAISVFGRSKYDALTLSFRREAASGSMVPHAKIEYILRSNGFCPTMAEVCEMQHKLRSEGGSCNIHQFLDLALSCESVSATTGMSELVKFFTEYDQDNRGVISTNIFRRLMSSCGEKFTDPEIEEIIQAFKSKSYHECVDYHAFITTISSS